MSEPRWRRYLRFWKRNVAADVDDELEFHFDERLAELEGRGLSRERALTIAREEFGDHALVRGTLVRIDRRIAKRRDALAWFDGLRLDLTTSLRSLARRRAFSAAVIVTLALGLGVNAAMFSFLDRVFVRMPSGIADPSQLRRLWQIQEDAKQQIGIAQLGLSLEAFASLSDALAPDVDLAMFSIQGGARFDNDDEGDKRVVRADANYLRLLGAHAQRGRFFSLDEARFASPAHVAVISDALWRGRYGADEAIIGKTLEVNGVRLTIIGVANPGFRGIDLEAIDVWTPMGDDPWGMPAGMRAYGNRRYASVVARKTSALSDDVVAERATLAIRRARAVEPPTRDSLHAVVAGSIIQARGPGKESAEIRIAERLGVIGVIVLLIACANVMNLLLAHAVARRREIAVRVALGISRARLIWLLMAPNIMLAFAAGLAAAASAWFTGNLLRAQLTPDVHFTDAPFHWRVVIFTLLAALAAGVLAALAPALQSSRPDVTTFLKSSPQSGAVQHSRLRTTLLVAQASLSVVLLVGAGLFLRSLWKIESIQLGYDTEWLMSAGAYTMQEPDSVQMDVAAERIRHVPGVVAVGRSNQPPMTATLGATFYTATDSVHGDNFQDWPSFMSVSRNYFDLTGMRIVRGTAFGPEPSPSIVVNETFAREYWPNSEPLGQCVYFPKRDSPCFVVAGIVEDAHRRTVVEKPHAHYFIPLTHTLRGMGGYTILMRVEPKRMADVSLAVRRILKEAFPGARARIQRMTDTLAPAYRPFRLGARLFTAFGLLAFVVAMVGVYSTISHVVEQRTHEFGVRIALGAGTREVLANVIPKALAPVSVGVAIGIGIALVTGRLIASLLYEVSARDTVVMVAASGAMLFTAFVAALIPARRASRVDPVIALRAD